MCPQHICVCSLSSLDVREQGKECHKSFGLDGATRHVAIHFASAPRGEIPSSLGGRIHRLPSHYLILPLRRAETLPRLLTPPPGHEDTHKRNAQTPQHVLSICPIEISMFPIYLWMSCKNVLFEFCLVETGVGWRLQCAVQLIKKNK